MEYPSAERLPSGQKINRSENRQIEKAANQNSRYLTPYHDEQALKESNTTSSIIYSLVSATGLLAAASIHHRPYMQG